MSQDNGEVLGLALQIWARRKPETRQVSMQPLRTLSAKRWAPATGLGLRAELQSLRQGLGGGGALRKDFGLKRNSSSRRLTEEDLGIRTKVEIYK